MIKTHMSTQVLKLEMTLEILFNYFFKFKTKQNDNNNKTGSRIYMPNNT